MIASRGFEEGILLTENQSGNLNAKTSKKGKLTVLVAEKPDLCNQSPDSFGTCSSVVLYFLKQSKSFMTLPLSAFHSQ